jgi:hypothetical protein
VSDEQITIPKLTAQAVLNTVITSTDFDDGMLDAEEVEALRALAVALGVDPAKATPAAFTRHYPHPYRPFDSPADADEALGIRRVIAVQTADGWTTRRNDEPRPYEPCSAGWPRCTKPATDPIHQTAEMGA